MGRVIGITVPYGTPIVMKKCGKQIRYVVMKNGRELFYVYNSPEEIIEDTKFRVDGYEPTFQRNHPLGARYYEDENLTPKERQWKQDFPVMPIYNTYIDDEDGRWIGGIGQAIAPVFAYIITEDGVQPEIFWRAI